MFPHFETLHLDTGKTHVFPRNTFKAFPRFGLGESNLLCFFRISGTKIQIFSARAFGARGYLVFNCGGSARKTNSFVSASFWRVLKTSPVFALCDPWHFDKIPVLSQNALKAQNFLSRAFGARKASVRTCVILK